MGLRVEHEIHKRRFGRNLGVGLCLAFFILVIFGMTFAKVTSNDFALPQSQVITQ